MVIRALLLVTLALAVALPARAGIYPAQIIAKCDSFQNGVWPDANFAGCDDARITHCTAVGTEGDSLNYGAVGDAVAPVGTSSIVIGGSNTAMSRDLFRWTFGSYLPPGAVIDSMFLRLNIIAANADSILGAIVLENWVEGSGDGTFDVQADTLGVTWRSYSRLAAGDSLWTKRGCDSAFTGIPKTGTARITVTGIMDQVIGGTVVYSSTTAATASDREGAWHFCGPITATGVQTINLTWARFIYNNLNATANYGIILRSVNGEGLSGTHRITATDSENSTVANRPKLIVYYHYATAAVPIGGGE